MNEADRREQYGPVYRVNDLRLPAGLKPGEVDYVDELVEVWMGIYQEKLHLHNRDEMVQRVSDFFDGLSEFDQNWLEQTDDGAKTTRAIMIKEHAIQRVQRGESVVNGAK